MGPSIRPVAPGPNAAAALGPRQGGQPFDLERELEREPREEPREDSGSREREPTLISPPADDEAGSHLDLTA